MHYVNTRPAVSMSEPEPFFPLHETGSKCVHIVCLKPQPAWERASASQVQYQACALTLV